MYRYSFRFVIMTLTILTANLLTNAISNFMVSYKNHYKPLIFTFFAMGITVLVFYPLFIKLEVWVKELSKKAIRSGRSVAGKYLGLVLVFITGLLILAFFYTRMWYHIDMLQILLHGTIGSYL